MKSKQWLEENVHPMGPKVVLTYGTKPFKELTREKKTKGVVAQATSPVFLSSAAAT